MSAKADLAAVTEEQRRADRLRRTVDVACAVLRQGRLTRAEGVAVVVADGTQFHRIRAGLELEQVAHLSVPVLVHDVDAVVAGEEGRDLCRPSLPGWPWTRACTISPPSAPTSAEPTPF